MARAERSLGLLISIACWGSWLICLTLADPAHIRERSASLASPTVQAVERLFNQVLYTTIEDARQRLPHLNASDAIDRQYFEDLDSIAANEDYYSTAYYIFAWINSQLMTHQSPDKLLLEVLPGEKIAIRNFFGKVRPHLTKYLRLSRQDRLEFMSNITRWASESEDSLVTYYLEFPRTLQQQLPELQLMDYTKLAKALLEGVATGIWSVL
ncbi:uncharacterized protein Hf [Drosophila kikkawai]|uniref:Uncharacterized protein Hf n=1 Tax=Drosophila kikkawai TaxID=30033 RepID=A0A6P4HTD6_DROKI|nr:uncharacterized protein LOC108072614 [Drosophila kikkawai]